MGRQSFLVEVVIALKNNTSAGLAEFKKGFANAANIPADFNDVMGRAGVALGNFTAQIPAMVGEMFQLGIESETATRRFEQFAGSTGRANALLEALQRGSDGTIDKLTGMQAAARLLQMGLVEDADSMEQVTAMAVKLGNQTQGAGDRIADFAALLANQSIPRLDNFGISSGKVRQRIAELLKSGQALNREEAFKMAVMEEGAKALQTLGSTSELTATKIAKITTAAKEAKIEIGEYLLQQLLMAQDADEAAEKIREIPEALRETSREYKRTASHYQAYRETLKEQEKFTDRLITGYTGYTAAISDNAEEQVELEKAERLSREEAQTLAQELERLRVAELGAAAAAIKFTERQDEAGEALDKTRQFALEASMALTGFFRSSEEEAERHAESVEELEQQHQAKVAEIMEQGKTRYEKIDMEGARLEARILRQRLAQQIARRGKFNAETTKLERLQTQQRIQELQLALANRTSVLQRAHNGWIAIAGKATGAMLAQEEIAYQEEKAALEEARAEQERIQRESFGRMILQQFNAWAAMKGIAADRAIEMQISLAERFGLIDEEAATFARNMITEFETWASETGKSADAVAQKLFDLKFGFAEFKKSLEDIPTDINVNVRMNMIRDVHQAATLGGQGTVPELMQQHGGQRVVGPGMGGPMRFTAGEGSGPEIVTVQPANTKNNNVRFGDVTINNGMDEAMLEAIVARSVEGF